MAEDRLVILYPLMYVEAGGIPLTPRPISMPSNELPRTIQLTLGGQFSFRMERLPWGISSNLCTIDELLFSNLKNATERYPFMRNIHPCLYNISVTLPDTSPYTSLKVKVIDLLSNSPLIVWGINGVTHQVFRKLSRKGSWFDSPTGKLYVKKLVDVAIDSLGIKAINPVAAKTEVETYLRRNYPLSYKLVRGGIKKYAVLFIKERMQK